MMDGWTPFQIAAVNGYVYCMRLLTIRGSCDVNHTDKFKRTVLHWVVKLNNIELAQKLIDLGVDCDLQDVEGLSAIDLAKNLGYDKMVEAINL